MSSGRCLHRYVQVLTKADNYEYTSVNVLALCYNAEATSASEGLRARHSCNGMQCTSPPATFRK